MRKKAAAQVRSQYTREFKVETVQLVKCGYTATMSAKILSMREQTLSNQVRLSQQGKLIGASEDGA